jgi:hypothetical protein
MAVALLLESQEPGELRAWDDEGDALSMAQALKALPIPVTCLPFA